MSRKRKSDNELWERVKKTTKPLHSDYAVRQFNPDHLQIEDSLPVPVRSDSRIVKPWVPEPAITVALASKPVLLDEAATRKIAKGRTSIDGRIDLHGMTQIDAHVNLLRFLEFSRDSGKRTVLVITGKGSLGEGVLKNAVPRWFSEPEFRQLVSGYKQARAPHGGSGALYVRIRRTRKQGT